MSAGIYKITNLIDGKCYIGQSANIEERYNEHKHHKLSDIDKAMDELGDENFSLEILQECSKEEMDELEDYYIQKFNSIENGYNIRRGGQHNKGMSNAKAKLTYEDVYMIREDLKNGLEPRESYEKVKDKVSFNTYDKIRNGKSWDNIHMDVYDDPLYSHLPTQTKNTTTPRKISDEEVYDIREQYLHRKTNSEVYENYSSKISKSYFDKIWNGALYQDIHYDVYTGELKEFQRAQSISRSSDSSIFSDEEVLHYREENCYNGIPITELHKEYMDSSGKCCRYLAFYNMVVGQSYKRVPIVPIKFKKKK